MGKHQSQQRETNQRSKPTHFIIFWVIFRFKQIARLRSTWRKENHTNDRSMSN